MTGHFIIEACYTDRSDRLVSFTSGAAAREALKKYNANVQHRDDRCGPVTYRLSAQSDKFGRTFICERSTLSDCVAVREAVVDAVLTVHKNRLRGF